MIMQAKPLTTFEVAKYCNVTHRTVQQWIIDGKLSAYRTPGNHSRVKIPDLLSFLQEYHMPVPNELRATANRLQGDMTKMLRSTLGKMEVALGSIKEAIVWVDLNGAIQWSNAPFDEIIGRQHILTLGANIFELLPLYTQEGNQIPLKEHPVKIAGDSKSLMEDYYEFVRNEERLVFFISASYTKITESDECIILTIQDITKRRKLRDHFLKAVKDKELAEEKLNIQREFTSTVSHELRTPLASIKSSIDILKSETPGKLSEDQSKFIGKVKSNVDRLNRLIDDILDLSKMESGKIEMNFGKRNVNEIIKEVIDTQRAVAQERGLILEHDLDESIPELLVDADKLIQVFNNLIGNAIKFTDKGKIVISTKGQKEKNCVRFCVQDTGAGIRDEDMGKLFQKFQQVGKTTEQVKGTGLGLVICKEIINRHHGKIWAESEYGQGTSFYFLLPLKERRSG